MMISDYNVDTSATTEVGWLALLVPVLVDNSAWATKSITFGVPDTYIKPLGRSSVYHVDMLKVATLSLNQTCRECTFLSMVSVCFSLSFVLVMMGRRPLVPSGCRHLFLLMTKSLITT